MSAMNSVKVSDGKSPRKQCIGDLIEISKQLCHRVAEMIADRFQTLRSLAVHAS